MLENRMPSPTKPADPTADFAISLLERTPTVVNGPAAKALLRGKRVLVTGAAGSIGSELARQAHRLGADVFYLDLDESRLHALRLSITGSGLLDDPTVVLADIRDARVFGRHSARFDPTSSTTPRLTSTCRFSSVIHPKASRPMCSAPTISFAPPNSPMSIGSFSCQPTRLPTRHRCSVRPNDWPN